MLKYCIKRILLSVLILLGVSMILYLLVRCMPTSYIDTLAGSLPPGVDVEAYKMQLKEYYGLADSSFWGICKGYWGWLTKFVTGDFGTSWKYLREVEDVIFENMGISFGLSLVALVLELIIAIPLGIKCACNQYGKLDYIATFLTMIGISFPTFFLGSIVI